MEFLDSPGTFSFEEKTTRITRFVQLFFPGFGIYLLIKRIAPGFIDEYIFPFAYSQKRRRAARMCIY
jgi:hypothetical protein